MRTAHATLASDYTDQQRLLQLIMIWVLPVIGASLSHFMLSDTEMANGADIIPEDSSDHHDHFGEVGAGTGHDAGHD